MDVSFQSAKLLWLERRAPNEDIDSIQHWISSCRLKVTLPLSHSTSPIQSMVEHLANTFTRLCAENLMRIHWKMTTTTTSTTTCTSSRAIIWKENNANALLRFTFKENKNNDTTPKIQIPNKINRLEALQPAQRVYNVHILVQSTLYSFSDSIPSTCSTV